jgi:hypothetical protein
MHMHTSECTHMCYMQDMQRYTLGGLILGECVYTDTQYLHTHTHTHTHNHLQGVNKGALVGHILSHYGLRGGLDFIMCLGDDSLDTGMYSLLRDFVNNQGSAQHLSLFACTVGKQPSAATHCLYTLEVRDHQIREACRGVPG